MTTFDVGIVGAGVHGASAAFHLASRGVKTAIFEKGTPASGPTGRSSAVCRAYYTNEFLARVARDSLRIFGDFEAFTAGRHAGYVKTGILFLHPASDAQHLRESAERLDKIGVVTEILDVADIAARFPVFDLEGIGIGAWEPDAGYADPAGTTIGLYERAVELGATARLGTAVTGIEERRSGGATIVSADGERAECARVLVAAGPWSRPLANQVGVDLPLTVERHIVATFAWGDVRPVPFAFADLVYGFYCKPEGPGQFGLGPLPSEPEADPDDFAEEVGDAEAAELAEAVVRRVPSLADAEPRGGWASLYDVSPDWQPVIGEIAPGVFVDCGTSGHGFKLAPALGAHVADLVTGADVDPGLEQFHPRRFAEGRSIDAGYGKVRILG